MQTKNTDFLKLWGMPILLGVLTFVGLISAIIGTGFWHVMSWVSLSIPLYVSVRYGRQFFEKKTR